MKTDIIVHADPEHDEEVGGAYMDITLGVINTRDKLSLLSSVVRPTRFSRPCVRPNVRACVSCCFIINYQL